MSTRRVQDGHILLRFEAGVQIRRTNQNFSVAKGSPIINCRIYQPQGARPRLAREPDANQIVDPAPGNNANVEAPRKATFAPYYVTEVGDFEDSVSPYGTYD